MTEPRRWLDDPDAPPELRAMLERAPRGRELDGATRSRLGRRVARYSAIPLSAAAWLSVKSAAALGVAAGVATASVVAVVEHTVLAPETPAAKPAGERKPAARKATAPARVEAPEALAAPEAAQVPEAPAALDAPTPTEVAPLIEAPRTELSAPPSPVPAAPAGLAEESLLLERARRALASAPALTLELTREHARRFPKPALAAERNLIEIQALYRTGRRDQARSLAERLLARGTDDLYAERVRRLIAKIDRGEAP